jgi:sugar phosphate isomerase/epimerase
MRSMSRRRFLASGAAGVAAAGCLVARPRIAAADPLGLPIGLQVYTVREELAKDFDGTLKRVAAAGYAEVELYSFFDRKAPEVRRSLEAAGLRCVSAHYGVPALQDDLGSKIDYAKELGLRFIVCPFPGVADPERLKSRANGPSFVETLTLDDWKWNADLFNRVGEQTKKAGIQFGYHNHHIEFREFGGVTAFDELLRRTDKGLVTIELDCGWVKVAGLDPAAFIAEHADRIALLHIKDVKAGLAPSNRFGPAVPFAEVGRGSVDWKKVFEAAKKAGVKRYYVEQDTTERPPLEAIKISRDYLHDLDV